MAIILIVCGFCDCKRICVGFSLCVYIFISCYCRSNNQKGFEFPLGSLIQSHCYACPKPGSGFFPRISFLYVQRFEVRGSVDICGICVNCIFIILDVRGKFCHRIFNKSSMFGCELWSRIFLPFRST